MRLFFIIISVLIGLAVNAQYRSSSIGLRLGGVSGISYKYLDDDLYGFELIAGAKEGGLLLTGLIQKYKPIATNRVSGLYLFTGAGAHSGYSKYSIEISKVVEGIRYYSHIEKTNPVLGGDIMLGAGYHFESIPLLLTLDYKPYFELFGEKTFRVDLWDIGFTIRYALKTKSI